MDTDLVEGFVTQNNVDNFNQPFTFILPGFNLRATDLQAFIGLRQIEKIDSFAEVRHRNHMLYANYLDDKFQTQKFLPEERISSISYALLADSKEERKKIIEALVKNGIETRMYSAGALYKHVFYKDYVGDNFEDKVSTKIHDCGLFLPNHHKLTMNDIIAISNVVLSVAARNR
jgi:CDP-6-deoxy-D-xylo-4-hexulose-3-dehydrase